MRPLDWLPPYARQAAQSLFEAVIKPEPVPGTRSEWRDSAEPGFWSATASFGGSGDSIGALDRSEMERDRPQVGDLLGRVAAAQGWRLTFFYFQIIFQQTLK